MPSIHQSDHFVIVERQLKVTRIKITRKILRSSERLSIDDDWIYYWVSICFNVIMLYQSQYRKVHSILSIKILKNNDFCWWLQAIPKCQWDHPVRMDVWCVYICIYILICVCAYVHTHIYIYITYDYVKSQIDPNATTSNPSEAVTHSSRSASKHVKRPHKRWQSNARCGWPDGARL